MLRRALMVLMALTLLGAGAGYHVWSEATALPDWYDDEAPVADLALDEAVPGIATSPQLAWEPVTDPSAGASTPLAPDARPRRRELRNFHLKALAREKAFRKAVRGSRAVYEDGRLEMGVVVDTGKIPRERLGQEGRALYDRAARVFPGARNRRIYLGITDEPASADGFLQLGRNPQVRVGDLTYSLGKAAKKMGVSPARLRRDINRLFRQLKLVDPDAPRPR